MSISVRSAALAVFAVALAITGCSKDSQPGKEVPGSAAPAESRSVRVAPELLDGKRIVVVKATRGAPQDELVVSGQVVAPPNGAAEVGALLSARVRSIDVKEGDRVDKGQLLARLDAPDVARIAGQLQRATARRKRAELVLSQEQQLLEQRATSQRAVSGAESELSAARADETAARLMLSSYHGHSGGVSVLAPIAGTVVSARAVIGQLVSSDSVLFRLVNPAQLVVRADVPEVHAGAVAVGAPATVFLAARHCAGVIESSARSVDPMRRTVAFRVRPGASCGGLIEGAFVDVELPRRGSGAAKAKQHVVVPRDAVVELGGVPAVFIATPERGRFEVRSIRPERTTEHAVYVARGLDGSEQVVTVGAILLKGEWMRASLE